MRILYALPLVLSLNCLEGNLNLDKCDSELIEKRVCVTENRDVGIKERICSDQGKFDNWSECKLEDIVVGELKDCSEGKVYVKPCNEINDVEILKCINNQILTIKNCGEELERTEDEIADSVCEDRAIQQGTCENGSEWLKICQSGNWFIATGCVNENVDDTVCQHVESRCGIENEGIRVEECVNDELVETQDCSSPSCEIISREGTNPRINSKKVVYVVGDEIRIYDRIRKITDRIRDIPNLGELEINENYLVFVNGDKIIKYDFETSIIGPFIERASNSKIRIDDKYIAVHLGKSDDLERFSSVNLLNGERWNFELLNYGGEFDFHSEEWIYIQNGKIYLRRNNSNIGDIIDFNLEGVSSNPKIRNGTVFVENNGVVYRHLPNERGSYEFDNRIEKIETLGDEVFILSGNGKGYVYNIRRGEVVEIPKLKEGKHFRVKGYSFVSENEEGIKLCEFLIPSR